MIKNDEGSKAKISFSKEKSFYRLMLDIRYGSIVHFGSVNVI
jgi:hypothetical protein